MKRWENIAIAKPCKGNMDPLLSFPCGITYMERQRAVQWAGKLKTAAHGRSGLWGGHGMGRKAPFSEQQNKDAKQLIYNHFK